MTLGIVCAPVATAQQAAVDGFESHGVPVPVAQPRGIFSTVDGAGRDVVLVWLQDYRGGYGLLVIDAQSGETQQVDAPFDPAGDEPFALWLSSHNRLYTLFNHHFLEFDVATRRFTLARRTEGKTAMSLTEDRAGRIWVATYPDNGLMAYDPVKGELTGHGVLGREDWPQYPRSMATDAQGWVYVGVGMASSQIYAFEPATGSRRALLSPAQRRSGSAEVLPSVANAAVGRNGPQRFLLSGGRISPLSEAEVPAAAPQTGGMQNYVKRDFPSGRQLQALDLSQRRLVTRNPAGEEQTVQFEYRTEGAALTFVCATPTHVCGGSRFPMQTFRLAPGGGGFERTAFPRQPNVMVVEGEQIYVAGYPDGRLYRFPTGGGAGTGAQAATDLQAAGGARPGWNHFEQLAEAGDVVFRPHTLLLTGGARSAATAAAPAAGQGGASASRSGQAQRWAVMAGTPAYGRSGGGMLFWPLDGGKSTVLTHGEVIAGHSTQTLLELPDGLLLGGTTTAPGTGGREPAPGESARLFLFDTSKADQRVPWSMVPVPGARVISDLLQAEDGTVWGIADSRVLFAFDPVRRQLVGEPQDFGSEGRSVFAQGTKALLQRPSGPAGQGAASPLFVLLTDGIGRIDRQTRQLSRVARAPAEITAGGVWRENRLWFGVGSHLYSWTVPD